MQGGPAVANIQRGADLIKPVGRYVLGIWKSAQMSLDLNADMFIQFNSHIYCNMNITTLLKKGTIRNHKDLNFMVLFSNGNWLYDY